MGSRRKRNEVVDLIFFKFESLNDVFDFETEKIDEEYFVVESNYYFVESNSELFNF